MLLVKYGADDCISMSYNATREEHLISTLPHTAEGTVETRLLDELPKTINSHNQHRVVAITLTFK
jgi:hypothetical protein